MSALRDLLLDPVIARTFGATLAIIFMAGAWQKLREWEIFRASVDSYGLLPASLVGVAAVAVPALEGFSGVLLVPAATVHAGIAVGLALMGAVTGAVIINLLRGVRDIDCGCGGFFSHVGEQTLGWGLVVRNVFMILALLLASGGAGSEGRVLVWIDYVSVACGTLALLGIYVSANQLMANQPKLLALRDF